MPAFEAPESETGPLRDALYQLKPWLLAVMMVAAVSALLRFQLIEPGDWIENCSAQPRDGWCLLRSLTIELFVHQRIGWFATASGVLSLLLRNRTAAGIAMLTGTVGCVLYAVEPGAFGTLLGLLGLASFGQTTSKPITATNRAKPSA
jgi:hypothetical protein